MFTRFKNRMLDRLAVFVFKRLAKRHDAIARVEYNSDEAVARRKARDEDRRERERQWRLSNPYDKPKGWKPPETTSEFGGRLSAG